MSDPAQPDPAQPGGEQHESMRLAALRDLEVTPRRTELRRLAAGVRAVVDHLVTTTATTEQLAHAADELAAVAELLGALPKGQTYLGAAEAALAGGWDAGTEGSERFAFFDHSPFIGLANPLSPPITLVSEPDRVTGTATFGAAYEGPPGCVHGGYVAAAFDELLGATQSLSGTQGMTAHLAVDYRRPTPLHAELTLEGRLESREGRKIWAVGTIHAGGELTAEARALFLAFDPGRFAELLNRRSAPGPTGPRPSARP